MIPAGVDLRADADHPRFKRTMSVVEGISDEICSLRALPILTLNGRRAHVRRNARPQRQAPEVDLGRPLYVAVGVRLEMLPGDHTQPG